MLPYTWMQLTASYARKHYPGTSLTWQANFVRYTLRMYGWKADGLVDLELSASRLRSQDHRYL
jgi:hypothetical protein